MQIRGQKGVWRCSRDVRLNFGTTLDRIILCVSDLYTAQTVVFFASEFVEIEFGMKSHANLRIKIICVIAGLLHIP